MTLILSASDLSTVANMKATVAAVEDAFREVGMGTATIPAPSSMQVQGSDACFLIMGGLATGPRMAAAKLLADIPSNVERGMATQRSSIILTDQLTGEPLALLDGQVPTRIRTAAATAVATRHLARPESSTLGLIGAGALAVAHVEAMLEVLPLDTVTVWSRSQERVEGFRQAIDRFGLKVRSLSNPRDVVENSDVVCTLTPSIDPIIKGEWLFPGQHVNAIGARPRTTHRELDSAVLSRSLVIVDDEATAITKSGDLLKAVEEGVFSIQDIHANLGDVVARKAHGRQNASDITLFNSVGVGLQDLAVGRLMLDAAKARGLGVDVNLGA